VTPELALAGVSALMAILALIVTVARARRTDMAALAERLARLETKVDVFWRGVSFDAARLLHSPHPEFARQDSLLERFLAETLTVREARELAGLMSAVVKGDKTDPGERMAASVVLRYLAAWYGASEAGG
jgi:hypothetical protein